jgi:hypothetical protein
MKLWLALAPIALAATAPVLAAAPTSQATVTLAPVGGSQSRGTALLTQSGNALTVMLKLPPPAGKKIAETGQSMMMKAAPMPAHIHRGTCPNPDPKPLYPLKSVAGGSSTTTLTNTDLTKLTSGNYAIVVHNAGKMVACGDIKQANPTGATQ